MFTMGGMKWLSFPPPAAATLPSRPSVGLHHARTEATQAQLLVFVHRGRLSYLAGVGDLLNLLPLPLTLVARLAVGLGFVGLEGGLPLHQLAHEVEVRRDDETPRLHVLIGVDHSHARVFHQVGDDDGGGARHPGLAVHQHPSACLSGIVCNQNNLGLVNVTTETTKATHIHTFCIKTTRHYFFTD